MTDHTHRNERNETPNDTMPANAMDRRKEPEPAPKPSQAEGDRETVEQSIKDKENKGEL